MTEITDSIYSVSAITNQIKKFLNQEFSSIWVRGEVREAKVSSNGHLFFTIKDEKAGLSCVIFYNKLKALKFKVEPGTVFNCFGSITVYEQRGSYQLVVNEVVPEGQGSFELAFNQLKKKLEREGLFDQVHKKPIPKYPSRVGIITSDKGAAIKDILKTIEIEFPQIELFVFPVSVQGEQAAEKISRMIELVNQKDWVELIIVTRGGGSREDLWAFNEEAVAQAIFSSQLPIISAVGHERDWLISDFVADHRASTPTEAANYICQFKKNLVYELPQLTQRLHKGMEGFMMRLRLKLRNFSSDHWGQFFKEKLIFYRQKEKSLTEKMNLLLKQKIKNKENSIKILSKKLGSLSPKAVLERGFALLTQDKKVITDLKKLKPEDQVTIYLKRDHREAKIIH